MSRIKAAIIDDGVDVSQFSNIQSFTVKKDLSIKKDFTAAKQYNHATTCMKIMKKFTDISNVDWYSIKILDDDSKLANINQFLNPLFRNNPEKVYNLNKCIQYQKPLREKNDDEEEEKLDFDAMDYEEQKERKLREKLKKYQSSMEFLVERTMENDGEIDLASMSSLPEEQKKVFIPNAEMFKEIMVEFIKAGSIDIDELRKERRNIVAEESCSFQLNDIKNC